MRPSYMSIGMFQFSVINDASYLFERKLSCKMNLYDKLQTKQSERKSRINTSDSTKTKNCCTEKCNRNITNYLYLSHKLSMKRQKTKKAKDLNRKVREVQTQTVKKLKKIFKLTRNKEKKNEVSLYT